jgi:hypothetical protein
MIKFMKYSMTALLLVIFFFSPEAFAQGIKKEMAVGYLRWQVVDSGDEGEGAHGWGADQAWHDGYIEGLYSSKAVMLGCKNWVDENGSPRAVKVSGHGQWETDDRHVMMPLPDAEAFTIHRYLRYQPPAITVDGDRIEDPFPLGFSDHVDPARVPGNADGLIESYVNTDMGVSFRQRAIGFSQKHHNKYLITEYVFINTGNTDLDEEIELPGQTIDDFYFLKQLRTRESDANRPWVSAYGQFPEHDIRVCYGYASRFNPGSSSDVFGGADPASEDPAWLGQLLFTMFSGETIIFASAAANDFVNDDVNQPRMTTYLDVDFDGFTFHTWNMTEDQMQRLYQVMEEGAINLEGINYPELSGTKPGHHGIPLDQRGFASPGDMEGFGYSASVAYSIGPYDLQFGDSIKIVVADLFGSISPEKAYEVGTAWDNDEATWGNMEIGGSDDILPPQYQANPQLIQSTDGRSAVNNWAKDNWVYSGRDSLFAAARAAQWAYQNNYMIPEPPRAPSIEVKSLPDLIRISWGREAEEAADDIAGYRVYRAVGSWYPHVPEEQTTLVGSFEKIHEAPAGVYEFEDKSAERGAAYHYAVVAYDDGNSNGPDFDGETRSLESNFILNATTNPGFLVKPGGTLEDIVVVPNPFNLSAGDKNFPNEPNKIVFFNVPSKCTIRIFTETGDLVRTIEHEGSGDAPWGTIPQEHSATEIGQIVVSGIYIAHIQTPDGKSTVRKFVVVR